MDIKVGVCAHTNGEIYENGFEDVDDLEKHDGLEKQKHCPIQKKAPQNPCSWQEKFEVAVEKAKMWW